MILRKHPLSYQESICHKEAQRAKKVSFVFYASFVAGFFRTVEPFLVRLLFGAEFIGQFQFRRGFFTQDRLGLFEISSTLR